MFVKTRILSQKEGTRILFTQNRIEGTRPVEKLSKFLSQLQTNGITCTTHNMLTNS
jgi:hypothetical protein